jgi:type I restriction enzyme, S subunit
VSSFTTIADACELVTDGTHYTPKDVGSGLPFLTVKDVSDSGLDFAGCSFISESDYLAAKAGNSAPMRGDVLFSKDGTVGKVHVVSTDQPFAVLSSLAILRPKAGKVDPGYLGHVLRSPAVLDDALKKKTGSAIRRIVLGDLKRVRLPLPAVEEQLRIAAILDQAETLRTQRRQALAHLDTLTQSLFLDMFGDPATNPNSWPVKTLKELGKVITGGTPPSSKEGMFDGPIPFMTPGDLESDDPVRRSITEAGAKEVDVVRAGSTLVCCIGATIGKVGMALKESAFNQQLNAVVWGGDINDHFGYEVMRFFKPTIVSWGASTTLPILKKSSFERIEIPVPPMHLQASFANRLEQITALKAMHKAALVDLNELFSALQSRAFAGGL